MVGHACNASAQGFEAGERQGYGWLSSEHQASLGHLRACHKRRRGRAKEEEKEEDNTGRKRREQVPGEISALCCGIKVHR